MWFLWAHQSPYKNGISIGSTIFVGLTVVSNRRTDHGTYGDNRPHLITAYIAMPPNSNNHATITGLVTDTDAGGVYVLRST